MSPLDYILSVNGPVRGVVRTLLPDPLTTPINTPLGITPPGRGGGGSECNFCIVCHAPESFTPFILSRVIPPSVFSPVFGIGEPS
jgi:hypothetical protein